MRTRIWSASVLATLCALAPASAQFPLSIAPNARYLQDSSGAPFPILGRTAWFLTSLTQGEYQTFLDDCAAKGYDAIEFHVINHDPRGNNEPYGGNGALPFLYRLDGAPWSGALNYGNINAEAPDLSTPNPLYWSHVDALLDYAEARGILAFLFPAYVGYAGGEQGWMQELVANGQARVHAYGAWIAARYAARGNLVWMMGGDMGTFSAPQTAAEQALLDGLDSVPGQLSTWFSAEWSSEMIATDQVTFGSAMTLNGAYSFSGYSAYQGRRAYAHTPVEPGFLLEEPYDEEGPDGNGVNGNATQPVRRFQWWGLFGSIGGYISGNGYIWPFNAGWQAHLNTQGAQDMARLNAFVRTIAWHDLVPSGLAGTGAIVTSGGSSEFLDDYVTAAATPDGMLLVAYVPPDHTGTITIDMTRLSGPVRARWFNPASAAYSNAGSNLPNTGTHVFLPPGDNGTGFRDWVLVLDALPAPQRFCDPGAGGVSACPCSNPPGGSARGCDNSQQTGGASLTASGSSSLSGDTLSLASANQTASGLTILLQGSLRNGAGVVFGQGVRCVAGTLRRLFVVSPGGTGGIQVPGLGDPSLSARSGALGDPIHPGEHRVYMTYYRDPVVLGGCPASATFNGSGALDASWN